MEKILSGNLNKEKKRRGWFIGHFMDRTSPFKSDDFEVKWRVHPKGEKKKFPAFNEKARTISILISGKFAVRFPDKEIILRKAGDFEYHGAKVAHSSEALSNSVVLTIRWPSLPEDQKLLRKK
ncbi:MAG: signal peptidase I [Nanoarchaeota archaeon]|nr:MAG: signal peptidase I [Nanoarchaeota archaeon]